MRMYYAFFDESYQSDLGIVMAAWAVEQDRYTRYQSHLPELYKTPVLNQIDSMLNSCDARAVLSAAKLPSETLRAGEIDGTNDVPRMARYDNVWSQSAVFLLSCLLIELFLNNHQVGTVDVHYDKKMLKPEHRQAFEGVIRDSVVREAQAADRHLGQNRFAKLRVRRVEQVPKPESGQPRDKFQVGTWVADRLCSHFKVIVAKKVDRITLCDLSDTIRKTTQQFDGKSFNAD